MSNLEEVTLPEEIENQTVIMTGEDMDPQFFDPNSPTQRVGGSITKSFKSSSHRYPMYSLSNTYTKDEIIKWEERIR